MKPTPRTVTTYLAGLATAATLLLVLDGPGAAEAGGLGRNTVGSPQLKAGAVKTSDLGSNAVTSAKLKNGAVGRSDLAAGAVPGQPLVRSGESMSRYQLRQGPRHESRSWWSLGDSNP